jgi:hypothetical protein
VIQLPSGQVAPARGRRSCHQRRFVQTPLQPERIVAVAASRSSQLIDEASGLTRPRGVAAELDLGGTQSRLP